MMFFCNLLKIDPRNCAAICFALLSIVYFASPLAAQPTGLRDLSPAERKVLTQQRQAKIDKIAESLKKDGRNVTLYKERLRLFYDLLELNFDNNGWQTYGDEVEQDLSHIVELEPTAESYTRRGDFRHQRLFHSPSPNKITELYPRNQFFESAVSDYLEGVRLASDSQQSGTAYSMLSGLYILRPQKLLSAPNFAELRAQIQLKPILDDFDSAIKYSRKALEAGAKQPYADGLKANLARTYMTAANLAVKLGGYKAALEFYEAGRNYMAPETSVCQYYAAWGNVYLKLNDPDKALEKFNSVTIAESANCAELAERRGDAFAAKGDSERALSDYDKALELDKSDSLERKGHVYIKRGKLFSQIGKTEWALNDLGTAAEKKYIANCPLVYRTRAEVYRKLGKQDLATEDMKTAANLENPVNCPSE